VMTPRLLDLFCGAGGAGVGYHRAGFEVVGVDINPMPHYPFEFHQGDALEYLAEHGHEFDAIHASPPCQDYSVTQRIHGNEYPRLIGPTRDLLLQIGKPYVIENVAGASDEMISPVILCGLMFNLLVIRHRCFETSFFVMEPYHTHAGVKVFTNASRGYSAFRKGATHICVAGNNFDPKDGALAMGIDWMTREELAEAIPPAYTNFIGTQLMRQLGAA
jgi:DNA (cytosine-5)-methyltransferase 1